MKAPSGNLYQVEDQHAEIETIDELLRNPAFRLERIVSTGQCTPEGQWYDQDEDEWVVLLTGKSRLRFDDPPEVRELLPGDYLHIPAHRRHRVEWTDPGGPTIWLAIHFAG